MANNYRGYLIKVNGNTIPLKLISCDTYNASPEQETDLDSYVDADGLLHRNVLPHARTKISFESVPLRLKDKIYLQMLIPTGFKERISVSINYWNDNTNTYSDGKAYMTPVQFKIKDAESNDILYQPLSFTFIEY